MAGQAGSPFPARFLQPLRLSGESQTMGAPIGRTTSLISVAVSLLALAGCASSGPSYNQLYLTSSEIAVDQHETAYDVLTKHRRLIVTGSEIALDGGNDLSGISNEYSIPLIIVNGDKYIQNPITMLRLIPADDVASVRIFFASQVPPEFRASGWEGGVLSVRTKSGTKPPG